MLVASIAPWTWLHLLVVVGYTVSVCFLWPAVEALIAHDEPASRVPHTIGVYNCTWSIASATAYFTGGAIVMARDLKIGQEGFEQTMSFRLPADTDVTVVLTAPVGSAPVAVLREVFPGGLRAPAWELFTPLAPTR